MRHTPNNLTALRWFAATLVFYGHAFHFANVSPHPLFLGHIHLGPLGVYIFFAISGYLIAQSWASDPNVFRFLARRGLRIFPALIVVTVLTVFILGPVFTNLSLKEYFTNPLTWDYLRNIFLYISYALPGVFEHNAYPHAVNGSLWSLPVEFSMYLLLVVLGFLSLPRTVSVVFMAALMLLIKLWALQTPQMTVFYRTDLRQVALCGVYFWVGVVFYQYNVQRFFALSNLGVAAILLICLSRWSTLFPMGVWVLLPFLTLGFGLATGSFFGKLTSHDWSYGIYIYAFPVQQSFANIWPTMPFGWYLATTFAVTLAFAAASWRFIEKPSLSLKPTRRAVRAQ